MLSRKATIEVYDYTYEISVDGAGLEEGAMPEETSGWFPHFPNYNEDAQGRLLYLYQPITASLANVRYDVNWLREHPRPHFDEVFESVAIVEVGDSRRKTVIGTLQSVTFMEAMEGLVEALRKRDQSPPKNASLTPRPSHGATPGPR